MRTTRGKIGLVLGLLILSGGTANADSVLIIESNELVAYRLTATGLERSVQTVLDINNLPPDAIDSSIYRGGLAQGNGDLLLTTSSIRRRVQVPFGIEYPVAHYEVGRGSGANHIADASPKILTRAGAGDERSAYDPDTGQFFFIDPGGSLYSVDPDTGVTEIVGFTNLSFPILAYDSKRHRLIAANQAGVVSTAGTYSIDVPVDKADWGQVGLSVTKIGPVISARSIAYDVTNDVILATALPSGQSDVPLRAYDPDTFEEKDAGASPVGVLQAAGYGAVSGMEWLRTGLLPTDPVLPGSGGGNAPFIFEDATSGDWFDPPLTDTYIYSMLAGSVFTDILDFPTGFGGSFAITVGGISLGSFGPGQGVAFSDYGGLLGSLLVNGGVQSFTLSGINPLVDTEDPNGFPLRLAFDTPTASFSMAAPGAAAAVPLPAPGVLALAGFGVLGLARCRRRRRAP